MYHDPEYINFLFNVLRSPGASATMDERPEPQLLFTRFSALATSSRFSVHQFVGDPDPDAVAPQGHTG